MSVSQRFFKRFSNDSNVQSISCQPVICGSNVDSLGLTILFNIFTKISNNGHNLYLIVLKTECYDGQTRTVCSLKRKESKIVPKVLVNTSGQVLCRFHENNVHCCMPFRESYKSFLVKSSSQSFPLSSESFGILI